MSGSGQSQANKRNARRAKRGRLFDETQPTMADDPPATDPPAPAKRRVVLTGATGFIGSRILSELVERGFEVVAVGRRATCADTRPGVIRVCADILGEGWQRWCEGCAAAIHLVGIIREEPRRGITFDRLHRLATERVVTSSRELGITRLVHMSALGARPDATTSYHRSKWAGEEIVRASGLRWTIFRPSVVFGPGDGFTTSLVGPLRRMPAFPVFGDGRSQVQPIAVEEVTTAVVEALDLPAAEGLEIELGGPEALSYDEVIRRCAAALGLRRSLVHVPLGMSRLLVRAAGSLPGAPITRDQLTMLLEGSTCGTEISQRLFGLPRRRFEGPTWLRSR